MQQEQANMSNEVQLQILYSYKILKINLIGLFCQKCYVVKRIIIHKNRYIMKQYLKNMFLMRTPKKNFSQKTNKYSIY